MQLEEALGIDLRVESDNSSSVPPSPPPPETSPATGGGGDVQGSAPLQPRIDAANERAERQADVRRQEQEHREAQAEAKTERERSEREHQEDLAASRQTAQSATNSLAPVPGSTSPYGAATVNGPAGPGGVVPREYNTPGGGLVRIGGKHPHR